MELGGGEWRAKEEIFFNFQNFCVLHEFFALEANYRDAWREKLGYDIRFNERKMLQMEPLIEKLKILRQVIF